MEVAIVIWIICAIASTAIASSKGNNGCGAFVLGFLFGPLGLLIVAVMPASRTAVAVANYVEPGYTKTCPFCRSLIPLAASVCRFCQRDFPQPAAELTSPPGACRHEWVFGADGVSQCKICRTFAR